MFYVQKSQCVKLSDKCGLKITVLSLGNSREKAVSLYICEIIDTEWWMMDFHLRTSYHLCAARSHTPTSIMQLDT